MTAATFEVGSNVVIVVTLVINFLTLRYVKQVRKEVKPNGGTSIKDAVHRTEVTAIAVADSLGVPHPTPPKGIPITQKEN